MYKRVMIVEDESSTRQLLGEIVRQVESKADIAEFSAMDGIYETAIKQHFDLFLLDIIIESEGQGDMSGLRFAEKIRTIDEYEFTPIIFVTSLEDAALYAYSKLHSFSYIEKPFKVDNMKKTISDALRYVEANQRDNSLFLRKEGIVYSVKCSEIVYIESSFHQLYFHKANGEVVMNQYKNLKAIMDEIDDRRFIQCSRNVIINKDYVDNIDAINKYVKMQGIKKTIDMGSVYVKRVLAEFRSN